MDKQRAGDDGNRVLMQVVLKRVPCPIFGILTQVIFVLAILDLIYEKNMYGNFKPSVINY